MHFTFQVTSLDFLKGMAHMEEWVQEQVTLEQFKIFTARENTSYGWAPRVSLLNLHFGNTVVNQH